MGKKAKVVEEDFPSLNGSISCNLELTAAKVDPRQIIPENGAETGWQATNIDYSYMKHYKRNNIATAVTEPCDVDKVEEHELLKVKAYRAVEEHKRFIARHFPGKFAVLGFDIDAHERYLNGPTTRAWHASQLFRLNQDREETAWQNLRRARQMYNSCGYYEINNVPPRDPIFIGPDFEATLQPPHSPECSAASTNLLSHSRNTSGILSAGISSDRNDILARYRKSGMTELGAFLQHEKDMADLSRYREAFPELLTRFHQEINLRRVTVTELEKETLQLEVELQDDEAELAKLREANRELTRELAKEIAQNQVRQQEIRDLEQTLEIERPLANIGGTLLGGLLVFWINYYRDWLISCGFYRPSDLERPHW
ncbi:hypothetical protein B0O99DRAFT_680581 [Bisporella sp. PMI_857]|nr:hypothetical protein B0O99DRAFT_680581 [Bisporella sp. PMI_857]